MKSDNADDFRLNFRNARSRHEQHSERLISEFGRLLKNQDVPDILAPKLSKELLEAHAREYLIDAMLNALNWSIDFDEDIPNVLPEIPVTSTESGRTRFLDYLGFHREDLRPCLVVEAKRPKYSLPTRIFGSGSPLSDTPTAALVSGLEGADVGSHWNEWLSTLRDYVQSVFDQCGRCPDRLVITNGDWMVVFSDPSETFISPIGAHDANIHVFINRDDIQGRYTDIFNLLEYRCVTGGIRGVSPGSVLAFVEPQSVLGVLHGALLNYNDVGMGHSRVPSICITPIVFLKLVGDKYLRVESNVNEFVPHDYAELSRHIDEVQDAAHQLRTEIEALVGNTIDLIPLRDHNGNSQDAKLAFVQEIMTPNVGETFVQIVTGEWTHYVQKAPTVPGCSYHAWEGSNNDGRADDIVLARRIRPRSFFVNCEVHHCCHSDVGTQKSAFRSGSVENASAGADSRAFCQIWRFETRLCCRTCSFEEVCTASDSFNLPCIRPAG